MSTPEDGLGELVPRLWINGLELTAYPYGFGWGADLGSPEIVRAEIESRLFDGELISSTRASNRELSWPITVEGASMAELAANEATLVLEVDKLRVEMAYDPGDGLGATTVFDAFRGSLVLERDDAQELALIRRYTLTQPALPFGRSKGLRTSGIVSVPPTSAWATVAAMDTTTGWVSSAGAGAISADAAVKAEGTASVKILGDLVKTVSVAGRDLGVYENVDTHTLAAAYTVPAGGGQLSLLVRHSSVVGQGYAGEVGLRQVELLSATGQTIATLAPSIVEYLGVATAAAAGFFRYLVPVEAGTVIAGIRLTSTQVKRTVTAGTPAVWYDAIAFAASASTSRQAVATVPLAGSVRAPGSVAVASPGATALGDVLVLTTDASQQPPGFLPACRAAGYQSAGTNTATAGLINATTAALGTAYTGLAVDVPLATLTPGTFEVWLRCTNTAATTFAAQAQLVIGGTAVGQITATEGDSYAISAAHRWVSAGNIQLPPQLVPAPDWTGMVRIQLKVTAGAAAVDEVVIAPVTGAVTILSVGTGAGAAAGDSTRVWIDAPSAEQPNGGWWRGISEDRANARSAIPDHVSLGRHVFAPPRVRVYVATPGVEGATSQIAYYPTFHTSAAS